MMRRVDPEPDIRAELDRAADYPKTATIVHTQADLDTLLAEKPPCWRWAAFASVLVQRRDRLRSRLRDDQLGYAAPSGERAAGGAEVGRFVLDRMDEMIALIKHVEDFMLTLAFVGVFGEPGDESSADAEGIVHTANRLMDYHDRFLGMVGALPRLRSLQRICAAAARRPPCSTKRSVNAPSGRVIVATTRTSRRALERGPRGLLTATDSPSLRPSSGVPAWQIPTAAQNAASNAETIATASCVTHPMT
jgi:hypothetical protein